MSPENGSAAAPLVSIGLPVYNGEKYLEQAVDSILSQTFTDFELILSDNNSTDRTQEICRRYAAKDPRVRYHRNATNIGGANNHNRTFELARGRFFRWAGHDDLCAPDLLARCVEVMLRDPEVVLCYTESVEIDESGQPGAVTGRAPGGTQRPHQRFRSIACSNDFLEESYGPMRADVLRETLLLLNYTGSDRTLLCELSLHGRFHLVQEPLFYKRFHPGNVYTDWRARMAWFDTNLTGKIVFPFWMQFGDYLSRISRGPLGFGERMRCRLGMLRWLSKYGKNMVKDVLIAAYMLTRSRKWRRAHHLKGRNWSTRMSARWSIGTGTHRITSARITQTSSTAPRPTQTRQS